MTYEQALGFIYAFTNFEVTPAGIYSSKTFDLKRMHALLDGLGNPERRFKSIHIAGTKGKGSTAALIESVVRQAGYRTALYTSPHLHTFRERIRTNGALISQAAVVAQVENLAPLVSHIQGLTTFELMTAIAFDYFAEQGTEIAVLETGLGGRLDATNVVTPIVSVLTSISFDHTAILGDTLDKIAAEKAGIIKPGIPAVIAPQMPHAQEAIVRIARERRSDLVLVAPDLSFSVAGVQHKIVPISTTPQFQTMRLEITGDLDSPTCQLPLVGRHQLLNAATAFAAVTVLNESGLQIPRQALCDGMAWVEWPGRFEVLSLFPAFVVDGAHNGDSARQLINTLRELFPEGRLHLVFGASSDKDINGMLSEIMPHVSTLVLTRSHNPRAADPNRLAALAYRPGLPITVEPDLSNAIRMAKARASARDIICVTGSLFIVAEARKLVKRAHGEAVASDPG